jgi:negative regulator of replication initiation
MAIAIATTRTTTIMSTYKTGIQIDSDVHEYLFSAKERPGESFNSAIRRELNMPPAGEVDTADEPESDQ